MSTGEKDVLQKALAEISKLRQSMGEGRFRELLRELKASNRICSCASEMVRSFDEEGGTFLRPYRHILRLIGNDRIERSKFRRTIRTFEPGEKSGRGGLKSYGKELRSERDTLAGILKRYFQLSTIKRKKLIAEQKNEMKRLKTEIPKPILQILINTPVNEQGSCRPAYKDLAFEWMARQYPCTKSTLIQIVRESSSP